MARPATSTRWTIGSSTLRGRSPRMRATASRTSLKARSGSASSRNSTVVEEAPSVTVEVMWRTPATPATAPSTALVTCVSISAGAEPGATTTTETIGRSTLGSRVTGSSRKLKIPGVTRAMKRTMEGAGARAHGAPRRHAVLDDGARAPDQPDADPPRRDPVVADQLHEGAVLAVEDGRERNRDAAASAGLDRAAAEAGALEARVVVEVDAHAAEMRGPVDVRRDQADAARHLAEPGNLDARRLPDRELRHLHLRNLGLERDGRLLVRPLRQPAGHQHGFGETAVAGERDRDGRDRDLHGSRRLGPRGGHARPEQGRADGRDRRNGKES